MTKLQTVAEMPEFQRRAKAIMSEDEREAAIQFIAANPQAGLSLGGGLRKVRTPPRVGAARVAGSGRSTFLADDTCQSSWSRFLPRTRRTI